MQLKNSSSHLDSTVSRLSHNTCPSMFFMDIQSQVCKIQNRSPSSNTVPLTRYPLQKAIVMTGPQETRIPQISKCIRQTPPQTGKKELQFQSLKTMSVNFNSHLIIFILDCLKVKEYKHSETVQFSLGFLFMHINSSLVLSLRPNGVIALQ